MRLTCHDADSVCDRACSGDEAVVINVWVGDALDLHVVPLCQAHAAGLRGKWPYDKLREGVWLKPLLWTYHRIKLYSERHLELECALGGRE